MSQPRAIYIGIGPGGQVLAAQETAKEAGAELKKRGVEKFWMEDDGAVRDLEVRQNPREMGLDKVMKAAGLAHVPESAVPDPHEAWERLYEPYFGMLRRAGKPPKSLATPIGLSDSIASVNAKLAKGAEVRASDLSLTMKADLVGVNLMPADKLWNRRKGPLAGYPVWYPDGPAAKIIEKVSVDGRPFGMRTFCLGSNTFCQASCLVFTGSNMSDPYNDHLKACKALALLGDTPAFLSLVDYAIERANKNAKKRGRTLLVRLNLLSDIPWEGVAPWLFERHPDVQFYDYTKVPGRRPPSNYDLTFSFSGTNAEDAKDALYRRNQRIAVVFLAKQLKKGEWVAIGEGTRRKLGARSMPSLFDLWGEPRPVVNADVNDARFLDPPNELDGRACVAGLTWKTPKGQDVSVTDEFGFVTPAYVLDGGEYPVLAAPVTPRAQGVGGM